MYIPIPQPQLLIRSLGFGVMTVEVVPCFETVQATGKEREDITAGLFQALQDSGLLPQLVVLDLDDCSRGFYLARTGCEPSVYELAQLTSDVISRLKCSLKQTNNDEFVKRAELLLNFAKIPIS
jgi:hypothetical protein